MQDSKEQAGADEAQPSKGNPIASEQVLATIKEVEDDGEPEPQDDAQDAILARQLAEELQGGMYAKVPCSLHLHAALLGCPLSHSSLPYAQLRK